MFFTREAVRGFSAFNREIEEFYQEFENISLIPFSQVN